MRLIFDFGSNVPIYRQLRDQIVVGIMEGKLRPGDKLPTIRALADESGINMMTVSKGYQLLSTEGYIITDRRKGAIINTNKIKAMAPTKEALDEFRNSVVRLRQTGLSKEDLLALCQTYYEEEVK